MSDQRSSTEQILQNLTNLQFIDSRIDEIIQLRGDLPDEILDIETDISRLKARVNKLEEEVDSLAAEKAKLTLDIETSIEKVAKYEDQQLSVRNNREYDALTKEIEAQKQGEKDARARLEEIAVREVEAAEELETQKGQLETVSKKYDEKQTNLDKVIEDTQQEEKQLLTKRKELEGAVEERYLRNYNRLRQGLSNGIAVVAMRDGAAFGMSLPPQSQVEVTRRNKIVIDENTGRIVVDPSFFEQAAKDVKL